MVSILPGARTPWDLIGSAIGQNAHQILPGAIEKGIERRQIQEGLNQIQNLTPEQISKMQPHQLIASILGPFAGTRQGAQYAEAILPTLEKLIQRNQLFSGGDKGISRDVASQQMAPFDMVSDLVKNQPANQNQINPLAGSQAFEPPSIGQGTPQVNPEKTEHPSLAPGAKNIEAMLQEAATQADPFKYIDFFAKTNKLAEDQRKDLYNEYLRNYEKEENRIAREKQFRDFAKGATGDKKYTDDEFNRLIRYSDKYNSEPSQTNKLFRAERDLAKYNNALSALEHARRAPGFFENIARGQGMAQKELSSAVKPLVELGEIDKAKELVADLGLGPIQTEKVVNDLPKESKAILNKLKSAPLSSGIGPSPGSLSAANKSLNKRKEAIGKLPEIINDAVKAGGDFTSLKLIRDDLFKKGYLEHEFATALQEAVENGLKLSDYQKTEQAELGRRQRRPFLDILFSKEPGEFLNKPKKAQEEFRKTLRGFE